MSNVFEEIIDPTNYYESLMTNILEEFEDPLNYDDALKSNESTKWLKAMEVEIESIVKNDVWELSDLPKDRKAISCKWVFKRKLNLDGSINKNKAKLMAKGFTQIEGIDYVHTYSPVAKFISIRIILAIVAYFDLELFQLDVKIAFLNGELNEDIYMKHVRKIVWPDCHWAHARSSPVVCR